MTKNLAILILMGILVPTWARNAEAYDNKNPFTNPSSVCQAGRIATYSGLGLVIVGTLFAPFVAGQRESSAYRYVVNRIRRFNEIPTEIEEKNAARHHYDWNHDAEAVERANGGIRALESERLEIIADLVKQSRLTQSSLSPADMEHIRETHSIRADKARQFGERFTRTVLKTGAVAFGLGLLTVFADHEVADILNKINSGADLDHIRPDLKRDLTQMVTEMGQCVFYIR